MAWYHRRLCVDNLTEINHLDEMKWLNEIMVENQKNYQIWHHRKVLVAKLNDPSFEKEILNEVFAEDSKNIHAWGHRIWVVRTFNLYDGELEFTEEKLKEDIRNNSVWNYRFFIVTCACACDIDNSSNNSNNNTTQTINLIKNDEVFNNEIKFALDKVKMVPANESVYSYIRGLLKHTNKRILDFPEVKEVLDEVINDYPEAYHAMALLLDWYIEAKDIDQCEKVIEMLVRVDYIRRKYWLWRKNQIKENISNK